ncbi:hypothetical protein BH10BAC5_BH10BAC5_20370 [soil metagenome]
MKEVDLNDAHLNDADFNFIAPFYDLIAFLVFGNNLRNAANYYLRSINADSKLLIIGGGTGSVLEFLSDMNIPLDIVYIDSSSKMIARSKKRSVSRNLKISFINGNEEDIPSDNYDTIISPFFLDLFNEKRLKQVLEIFRKNLNIDGNLIVTDFRFTGEGTVFQRSLSFLMHMFFRLFTGIESKRLKKINSYLLKCGFKLTEEKCFYKNFIYSGVYETEITEGIL